MSAKENKTETDKVMTKYDLKMQKRAEDKRREERSLMIWKIVGVVLVAALIGFILSFPVRNIIALRTPVVTVDGEKIGRVEFDYVYNTVKNTYIQNYGSYLSYYGLTDGADPATVMYSDKLTFKDYFEQLAAEQLKENVAIDREAKNTGFTYDAGEKWKEFVESAEKAAKESDMNVADYLKNAYGEYATKARLKSVVEKQARISEYYQSVYDSKLPSDEEVESYYSENKSTYDSVDYSLVTVNAQLPTEPTELADEGAAVAEDGSYTPSDAEKEAAMKVAKESAEREKASVFENGEPLVNQLSSSVNYNIRDWLFDESRKEGDTTVIENTASNLYYVVGFTSRYRSEEPTVNLRGIVTESDNGAEILEKYNAGEKTEESFIELVEEYSIDDSTEGGLFENQNSDTYSGDIKEWIFNSERKRGDVESFFVAGMYTYVIYYLDEGEPVWKLTATDAMMTDRMNEYLDGLTGDMEVTGNLAYLTQQAEEDNAESTEDTDAGAESTESSESTEATETTEETGTAE